MEAARIVINNLKLKYGFVNFIILAVLYLLVYVFLKNEATAYTWILISGSQLSLDLTGLYIGIKLFNKSHGISKKIFFWWSAAFLGEFIADTFYNTTVNLISLSINDSFLLRSLIDTPFLFFIICQSMAWGMITARIINIKKTGKISYLHIPIIIMGIIVLSIFLSAVNWNANLFIGFKVYQIADTVLEVIAFVIVSICFVATNITPIRLIATGFLIIIACDSALKINFIYHSMSSNNVFDVCWVFGSTFMVCGLYKFGRMHNNFKHWNSRANTIQSQFTFWIFILCFLFLIIFLSLDYLMFSGAPFFYHERLKVLACVLIILTIIMLWVSYIFTKKFLQPLHKMREAIRGFISTNKPEIKMLESSYDIIEYHQLNSFIRDSFITILDKQKIQSALVDNAAQVVHDIGSPLTTMEVAIKNLEKLSADRNAIDLLKSSMLSVRSIAGNLLNRYRDFDDSTLQNDITEPRYIILPAFIKKIVNNKITEWGDTKCHVNTRFNLSKQLYWAFISPSQLARKLSNLLNNAYESLNKSEENISLYLSVENDTFELIIEDNGCGIPPDKINDVLTGKSLKPSGNGIGLSHAVKYFNGLNGSLRLESVPNKGTKVRLTFPVALSPGWYPDSIRYNVDSIFVILDDDISIHNFWQKKLSELKIVSKHFVNSNDFFDWYYSEPAKSSMVFLIDYELHDDKYTGLELIAKLNLTFNTYLVTSNAESFWIQNAIGGACIKMIPKSLIGDITLQKEH